MLSKNLENPIIAVSVRVYQALLVAYPTKFQQEYGPHMLQVFRDCCLRTFHQSGTNGMVRLWVFTLFDLIQSIVSEHRQKEIEMKKEMKPQDVRMAGWALILGSVVLSLGIFTVVQTGKWYIAIALVALISMPLLAFGLLGLRRRYGDQVGGLGRNMRLIGAIIGPLVSIIGYLGEVGLFSRGYEYWFWIFVGPALLFACLALFGVAALFKKPLPRWNILPFLAGFWFPVVFTTNTQGIPETVGIILLVLQGIALAALGYVLISDVPEETPATA